MQLGACAAWGGGYAPGTSEVPVLVLEGHMLSPARCLNCESPPPSHPPLRLLSCVFGQAPQEQR